MSTDEKNVLKRQYGLFAAICVVVNFIVGTGIFWRPGRVLYEAGGDIGTGVLAWIVGGLMILPCVYMFAVMGRRYEKVHGMVDYAEAVVGKRYGYLAGWFFCIMYQTAGYAIIAWISASFTAAFAGHENVSNTPFVFCLAAFYMVIVFVINYLAPKLPMRLNVGTTAARLVPLVVMGTIGFVAALVTRDGSSAAKAVVPYLGEGVAEPSFLGAVFATVFAYNGWQAAAAFNSEINDSKRNFPLALLLGFVFVMVIFVLYFLGVTMNGDPQELMANNQLGTRNAFSSVFGAPAGYIVMIFVIISGLGILNMCCMGMSRSLYSLARRGLGPIPHRMVQLDPQTNVPVCSMITCVGTSFLWTLVIYGNYNNWFGTINGRPFRFDLPDFYNMCFFTLLIPIFARFLTKNIKNKDFHWFNRIAAPALAVCGCGFMLYSLVTSSLTHAIVYWSAFIALALVGFAFMNGGKRREKA